MENCTAKSLSPIRISMEIMSIQTRLYSLMNAVPYDQKYHTFRDRLMDASINLASASYFLELPNDENV